MLKGKGGWKFPFTDYSALNYFIEFKHQELNKVSTLHTQYKSQGIWTKSALTVSTGLGNALHFCRREITGMVYTLMHIKK